MASVGKSEMEHMFDGVNQMYDVLLTRFMIINKSDRKIDENRSKIDEKVLEIDENRSEKDTHEYLTTLAKSAAFLAQTNSSISKSYKQEKRLKAIEEKLKKTALPTNMGMFDAPRLEQYR